MKQILIIALVGAFAFSAGWARPKPDSPKESMKKYRELLKNDPSLGKFMTEMHDCIKTRKLSCFYETVNDQRGLRYAWNKYTRAIGYGKSNEPAQKDFMDHEDIFWVDIGGCFPEDPAKVKKVHRAEKDTLFIQTTGGDGFCSIVKTDGKWNIVRVAWPET